METIILKVGFFLFFALAFLIQLTHFKRTSQISLAKKSNNLPLKLLHPLVIIGMVLLPMLYLFTPWFDFADYHAPAVMHLIGFSLVPTTLWLFYRCNTDLSLNEFSSLHTSRHQPMVAHGVYRAIRNPMHTAIWSSSLIQAFLINNYLVGFAGLFCFSILHFINIRNSRQPDRSNLSVKIPNQHESNRQALANKLINMPS
ncbi:MAG: hypothetical protein HRU40_06655 [Saprospiraceae bacterium]|nr:hypothetical protein [Saprospiraceae bacterium]